MEIWDQSSKATVARGVALMAAAFVVTLPMVARAQPATRAAATRPMVVYDSLVSYKDKPDTTKLGMRPIYVADREFWRGGDTSEKADTSAPNEKSCRALGAKVARMNCPLVLDIEHWPMDIRSAPEPQVDQTIEKFKDIVRWCRAGARKTSRSAPTASRRSSTTGPSSTASPKSWKNGGGRTRNGNPSRR